MKFNVVLLSIGVISGGYMNTSVAMNPKEYSLEETYHYANRGHPIAMNDMGIRFEDGYGVPQDFRRAFAWYLDSAKCGCCAAQYNVARLLEVGKGCDKNIFEAAFYYRLAAEKGHMYAQHRLANILDRYFDFEGREQEVKYWRRRADREWSEANMNAHLTFRQTVDYLSNVVGSNTSTQYGSY